MLAEHAGGGWYSCACCPPPRRQAFALRQSGRHLPAFSTMKSCPLPAPAHPFGSAFPGAGRQGTAAVRLPGWSAIRAGMERRACQYDQRELLVELQPGDAFGWTAAFIRSMPTPSFEDTRGIAARWSFAGRRPLSAPGVQWKALPSGLRATSPPGLCLGGLRPCPPASPCPSPWGNPRRIARKHKKN